MWGGPDLLGNMWNELSGQIWKKKKFFFWGGGGGGGQVGGPLSLLGGNKCTITMGSGLQLVLFSEVPLSEVLLHTQAFAHSDEVSTM